MDKNIAALMRKDARTVHVIFMADDAKREFLDGLVWPQGADPNVIEEAKRQIQEKRSPAFKVNPGSKTYTYVTDLLLEPGDTVVVPAANLIKLVRVVKVDDHVDIEPDADIEYQWVVAKLDMAPYRATLMRNAEISAIVAEGVRTNMRRTFAEHILGSMSEKDRKAALELIDPPKRLG